MPLTLLLAIATVVALAFAAGAALHVREFKAETREILVPRIRKAALEEGAAMLRRRGATKRDQNIHAAIEDEQCASALEHLARLDPDELRPFQRRGDFRFEAKLFGEVVR